MIKKIIVLMTFVVFFHHGAYAQERMLLGEWLRKAIQESDTLKISNLKPMQNTPVAFPRMDRPAVAADSEVKKLLTKHLLKARELDPSSRFGECNYAPGYQLTFFTGAKQRAKVLACFNCDVWAIGGGELFLPSKDTVTAFGDLRTAKKEVLRLLEKTAPSPDWAQPQGR